MVHPVHSLYKYNMYYVFTSLVELTEFHSLACNPFKFNSLLKYCIYIFFSFKH